MIAAYFAGLIIVIAEHRLIEFENPVQTVVFRNRARLEEEMVVGVVRVDLCSRRRAGRVHHGRDCKKR
jgi:hypothetical protein